MWETKRAEELELAARDMEEVVNIFISITLTFTITIIFIVSIHHHNQHYRYCLSLSLLFLDALASLKTVLVIK